jgi:hypothetical protein
MGSTLAGVGEPREAPSIQRKVVETGDYISIVIKWRAVDAPSTVLSRILNWKHCPQDIKSAAIYMSTITKVGPNRIDGLGVGRRNYYFTHPSCCVHMGKTDPRKS